MLTLREIEQRQYRARLPVGRVFANVIFGLFEVFGRELEAGRLLERWPFDM